MAETKGFKDRLTGTTYDLKDATAREGVATNAAAIEALAATVPAVDDDLETAGAAADAKKTGDEISDLKSALEYGPETINLLTNATKHAGYKLDGSGVLTATSTHDTYEIAYDGSYSTFDATVQSNSTYDQKAIAFYNSGNTVISTIAFESTSAASVFENVTVPSGTATIYVSGRNGTYAAITATAQIEKSQRLSDIESGIDGLQDEIALLDTANAGDVGKVPKVKTVSNGKVTEWEFGDLSNIVVDNTLTQSGEAADAKVTGDKIGLVNHELNFVDATVDLIASATKHTGYKLNGSGALSQDSTCDTYEIAYDGFYSAFNATVWSNTTYDIKAIAFHNSSDAVISTLSYTSTSSASTFTNQTIPAETAKIYIANKQRTGSPSASAIIQISKRLYDIEEDIADAKKFGDTLKISTKNLFDISKATDGYLIYPSNGALTASSGHIASDYIAISEKTIYTISAKAANTHIYSTTGLRYAFYNSSKTYISGFGDNPPTTFRTPANAAYIRFSMYDTLVEMQLERRSFATKYAGYNSYVMNDESDTMFLTYPAKVYAVTGLQYNWYTFNVTPERHPGQFDWKIGRDNLKLHDYGRFARLESNNSSTSDITMTADARSLTKWAWKAFTVKVKNPANLQNVSVLILGDSTTANGYVATDLHTYSGNESKITTLGTKGTAPNNHEGRSGWTLNRYFTESEDNPFYNPSTHTFDAEYYFSNSGVSVPDIFIINLGINDMHYNANDLYDAKATADAYIEKVNAVIASLRLVSATMKIAICLTIPPNVDPYGFGAAGTNIIYYDQYRIANLVLCEKLIDEYDYRESEYIYVLPINSVIDTKYNMPSEEQYPNSRASEKIVVPNTAGNVHPNQGGYYQISDEMYAFICSLYVS